jgi:peroxiredoxin Q/BCP
MTTALRVGDVAPDFVRWTAGGERVQLGEFRGRQHVVLFFYPRENTTICTAEACAFRDHYADFAAAGAVVIGVSGNSSQSQHDFAQRHHLPFHLVSDADRSLRELYGVANRLRLIPRRATFVIDKLGFIQLAYTALFRGRAHVDHAMRVLAELRSRADSAPPQAADAQSSAKTPQR